MSDIIDEIDRLVDEQLAAGPQDDYNTNRYDKCWHCRRDWHGMPITERIEQMRAIGVFDEGYRVSEDDSPVICPGSDFIGPMPTPRGGQPSAGPFDMSRFTAVGHGGRVYAAASWHIPPESRERWWRIHLPIDAEIEHRRAGHYMERNTTTLTIGERSATWPTENVIVSREPGEEVQMFQAEAPIRISPDRLVVDVLAETAPGIGGTWAPLTAPGVARHPDHGPLCRIGPDPWDYVFDPQEGGRVSFQTSEGMLTGVITEVGGGPDVSEFTIEQQPRRGFGLDYIRFDEFVDIGHFTGDGPTIEGSTQ